MDPTLALGWDHPLGAGGTGGWNWWTLAGAIALFLLVQTGRRRPHIAVSIVLAAIGGLIVGDLTQAWGIVPVWGALVSITLIRGLRVRSRPGEV